MALRCCRFSSGRKRRNEKKWGPCSATVFACFCLLFFLLYPPPFSSLFFFLFFIIIISSSHLFLKQQQPPPPSSSSLSTSSCTTVGCSGDDGSSMPLEGAEVKTKRDTHTRRPTKWFVGRWNGSREKRREEKRKDSLYLSLACHSSARGALSSPLLSLLLWDGVCTLVHQKIIIKEKKNLLLLLLLCLPLPF